MNTEQLIEMLESAMQHNTVHIRSAVMAELLNNVIGYVQDAASSVAQDEREAKLAAAIDFIRAMPHGDNCFVSDHYEGDPGSKCNCSKDSLLDWLEEDSAATPAQDKQDTADKLPTYVIVHRPGLVPDRKGGFHDKKYVENMLRELYEIYPDCVCDVITMPSDCYPESGRTWIDMYGDKRRKPLPEYKSTPLPAGSQDKQDAVDAAIWKPVPGYEGMYQVSRTGEVMALDRIDSDGNKRKQTMLAPYKKAKGYLSVSLWNGNSRKEQYVHRLVAMAFLPNPAPENLTQVNHIDGIRTNNCVSNLEWVTSQENAAHGKRVLKTLTRPVMGTHMKTGEKVIFNSLEEAVDRGFIRSNIQKCIAGSRNHHHGYTWSDYDAAMQAQGERG